MFKQRGASSEGNKQRERKSLPENDLIKFERFTNRESRYFSNPDTARRLKFRIIIQIVL